MDNNRPIHAGFPGLRWAHHKSSSHWPRAYPPAAWSARWRTSYCRAPQARATRVEGGSPAPYAWTKHL